MPALRDLLARHAPLLLIDTASARVQAGWFEAGREPRWTVREEEAGTGLFRALDDLGVDPGRAAAFAFCEGPGSILGIRTAAMALRTWAALQPRPIFAYPSLSLVAHALGRRNVSIIVDARREAWHCATVGADGTVGPLRRVAAQDLTGSLVMPDGFRHWSALPALSLERVPYDVPALLAATAACELFHAAPEPDAYLHEEPAYATWTPQAHQAPSAP